MKNELIHVAIRHKIYEWCIDILFGHIMKNFPKKRNRTPKVGEKYVSITHKDLEETYYNCTVVHPTAMEDYDDFTEEELKDLVFVITYKKIMYKEYDIETTEEEDDDGPLYQYFISEDMEYLRFKQ